MRIVVHGQQAFGKAVLEALLKLLPRLANEAWITDPGRAGAVEFLAGVEEDWHVESSGDDDVTLHRLRARA